NVTGHLTKPCYSRLGDQIAILYTENAQRATGPTQAALPEVGVMGERVDEQRLSLVDLKTGSIQPISPVDQHVYEYDWSPDGKKFVAIAAEGDGDNNWYIARLLLIDVSAKNSRVLLNPKMQIAHPRWSPNGEFIAYIGGLMSDEGIVGGDIYHFPVEN